MNTFAIVIVFLIAVAVCVSFGLIILKVLRAFSKKGVAEARAELLREGKAFFIGYRRVTPEEVASVARKKSLSEKGLTLDPYELEADRMPAFARAQKAIRAQRAQQEDTLSFLIFSIPVIVGSLILIFLVVKLVKYFWYL